ncbi:MAG: hypothetical protein WCW66_03210 [Patescibacteria group bacterium]
MADTLSNSTAVQDSLEVAAKTANTTLESDIDLPVEKIDLDISSLKLNIRFDGAGHKDRIRGAANPDKKEQSAVTSPKAESQSKGDVGGQEGKKELENRKRQFRMSQLADRRGGNPNMPSQGTAAGSLPEDLNPQQQSGADNMLKGIRNEREQPGANQLRRKLEYRLRNRAQRGMAGPSLGENNSRLSGAGNADDLLSNLDFSGNEDDDDDDSQPMNVQESQEQQVEERLARERERDRQNQKSNKDKNVAGAGGDYSLLQRIQIEVNTYRNKIKKIDEQIAGLRKTLILLMTVLAAVLGKDVLDVVGFGLWGWVDWLFDIQLMLAAFILKIEQEGKEKIEGWMLSLVELIPYADVLPAWTARVLKSVLQRNKELGDAVDEKKKIQKKLDKALKFRQALLNLPEEDK